jgi:hypothetical protein
MDDMISVGEALEIAAGRAPSPPQPIELTEAEKLRFDYVDATIEAGIYKGFFGEMFDFRLPVIHEGGVFGTPALVGALKRHYEDGGWSVAVIPRYREDAEVLSEIVEWQFVFAPTSRTVVSDQAKTPPTMPPVAKVESVPAAPDRRLLLRMPTRGRPIQALQVLELYRRMAGVPVIIEVVLDGDDQSMLNAVVLQRLAALDCVVTVGWHMTKVEACNGGRVTEWDVMALTSDDMVPVRDGFAVRILEKMETHWPHLDGALFFDDGFQHGQLCTLPIMGKRFHAQRGFVYAREYKSLWCDREQTESWSQLGRLVYVDERIIEHRHHLWGRAEKDALYERNDAYESGDKAVYHGRRETRRAHAQFGFDSPPLWLSILICSVPERRARLRRLLVELWNQILHSEDAGPIISNPQGGWMWNKILHSEDAQKAEILVDDRVEPTIGEKRQALVQRARGHFVAFIDDDDGVSPWYIERVVRALQDNPEADCASLVGVMTTNGGAPERFEHSIKYEDWGRTSNGLHVRCPNHLNAIRRELALQVGFQAKSHAEDFDFSNRLRPLLSKEASTGDDPLYFYWTSK